MSNIRSNAPDRLADMFKALSNPQRLRMFVRLVTACDPRGRGPKAGEKASYCCATEAGADLNLAASTVSHHLKELRQAGLVDVERHGRRIDCRVSEEALRLLVSFLEECGSSPGARTGARRAGSGEAR
jgi:ArsR family transcriptional regulator, arsenate/arsenite/antimonite-responsive transcriptional repressor